MSKTIQQVLVIPGESGWETWTRQGDGVFEPLESGAPVRAGDLADLPAGDLVLCFPARSVTALPVRVSTDDESLFPDLVALHAERLGLRADPMAGQLTDWFVVESGNDAATLLAVFLKAPGDGDLPPRGPNGFDLSARAFPVEGDRVAVWKEFGRWVFAIFAGGKLVYSQATAGDASDPDEALARDIQLAGIQLAMQGIEVEPKKVLVWSSSADLRTAALSTVLGAPCEVYPRPLPVLPDPLSRLLPADVRAARRAARQRRNIIAGVGMAVAAYLLLIGWAVYGIWKDGRETKRLATAAHSAAPDATAYSEHLKKWDELANAIDLANSPVDILHRVASCIPPNSGLRLKIADISAREIKLTGEAQTLEAVNTFSLKLSKHNELANFEWQTPDPSQSTRGWDFVFTGEVPVSETQP